MCFPHGLGEKVGVSYAASRDESGVCNVDGGNQTLFSSGTDWILWESAQDED